MNKGNQKQLKLAFIIVGIVFLIFFILSIFYFCFYVDKENSRPDALMIDYHTKRNFIIENKLPLSDSLGKIYNGDGSEEGIQEYFSFTVKNNTKLDREFTIFLDKQYSTGNEIQENYIKVYLTNEKDVPFDKFSTNPVPTLNQFYVYSKIPSSRVIYKGTIEKKSSQEFKLRVWLSDSYIISSQKESFSMNLNVE